MSPALAGGFFTTSTTWEALSHVYMILKFCLIFSWWSVSCQFNFYTSQKNLGRQRAISSSPSLGIQQLHGWHWLGPYGSKTKSCLIFSFPDRLKLKMRRPLSKDQGNEKWPLNWEASWDKTMRQAALYGQGSVYYRVTYSQGGIQIRWSAIQKHLQLHSTPLRGHRDTFMASLRSRGMCLEIGHELLSQDCWMLTGLMGAGNTSVKFSSLFGD